MVHRFDVAARLAEGRPAVDNIQQYVWACHLLGYQHPDLTLHAEQIRDWYSSEDGLDLWALDADCAALRAATTATEHALRLQDDQLAAVLTAWQGVGAGASREFLLHHGVASADATAALRSAADLLADLRDNLWHIIDEKVATAMDIEGRRHVERADWLAAVQTLTTGAGDRAVASELIDQQVKPFVDNDIRMDWLPAMRTTMSLVADSYDVAIVELAAESAVVFQVPGDLGPSWAPSSGAGAAMDEMDRIDRAAAGVAMHPATAGAPPMTPAPVAPSPPPVAPAAPPPPTSPAPVAPSPPPVAPAGTATADAGGDARNSGRSTRLGARHAYSAVWRFWRRAARHRQRGFRAGSTACRYDFRPVAVIRRRAAGPARARGTRV